MFITKYNPATGVDSFLNAFDREFFPVVKRIFNDDEESSRQPKANINEREKEFILTLEMPGVSKDQVEVSVDGEMLLVEAERTEKVDNEGLLRSEIRSDKYRRIFQIGSKIDRDAISAKMENGVLKLTLPKKAEILGRKIDISRSVQRTTAESPERTSGLFCCRLPYHFTLSPLR